MRDAKRLGFMISTNLDSNFDIIILELTKSRETNLRLLYLAEEHLNVRGKMIINGDNQIGVKSFLKTVSTHWPAEIILTKKKVK